MSSEIINVEEVDSFHLLKSTSIPDAEITEYSFGWIWRVAVDHSNLEQDGSLSKTGNITASVVNWQTLGMGLIMSQFYSTAIVPDLANDSRILGCMHDNGVYYLNSYDEKKHWRYMMVGDGAFAAFVKDHKWTNH